MIEATHERLSAAEKVVAGSDRSFGVVMAVACSIIALINLWQGGWLAFGLLLHQVLNPIVLALLFFGAVLPTGLVMRALGKDLLRLRLKPETDSYWIARQPPGPAPESMVDQF